MRNENVTPSGSPALVNPIKIGIEEQEQNGVTVPSNDPDHIRPDTMESSHNLLTSLRWKITLNIRNQEKSILPATQKS